jgi:hypothetical protein
MHTPEDWMRKAPLYRKVNTLARGVHHGIGGDFRHERNSKQAKDQDITRASMHGKKQRGLDYTPLFRFLLSKVGQDWADVHSEACSRLDREEPIFWLVARSEEERWELVRIGESSYYSGLFVDENDILRQVNPKLGPGDLPVTCTCCTYTLNGIQVAT